MLMRGKWTHVFHGHDREVLWPHDVCDTCDHHKKSTPAPCLIPGKSNCSLRFRHV